MSSATLNEEGALLLQAGFHIEELQQGAHRTLSKFSYTNGVILALYHFAGSSPTLLRTWLYILAGTPDTKDSVDLLHKGALHKRVEKLKRELLKLSKKKDPTRDQEREEFLQASFTLPSLEITRLSAAGLVTTAACAVSSAANAVAEVAARAAITVAENEQEIQAANAETVHVMEMSKEFATGLTKEFLFKQEILVVSQILNFIILFFKIKKSVVGSAEGDGGKTYANTVEDLIADRDNGDFEIL